ncbi:hypothetical protein Gasu2_30900 [Galdieria sulphuraria]|nr:hypothetical protein Gasu2_30900 [Galdieria sulphuraria]
MASSLSMTCASEYETIYHSLGRIKLLLEKLNSGTSEKLSSFEQKSRLIKDAIAKRYEPLASDYVEDCIDKMREFYLQNLEDISLVSNKG